MAAALKLVKSSNDAQPKLSTQPPLIPKPPGYKLSDYARRSPAVEIRSFLPSECRAIADDAQSNRPVDWVRVKRYARMIRDGIWHLHSTVSFAPDGRLLDGRTRMYAGAEAGLSLKTAVMYGVPPEAWDTIDTGRKRTLAQTLHGLQQSNANNLGAVLSLLWRARNGGVMVKLNAEQHELIELFGSNKGIAKSVSEAMGAAAIIRPSVSAYCHYEFNKRDKELAALYLHVIKTGDAKYDHPFFQLRERYQEFMRKQLGHVALGGKIGSRIDQSTLVLMTFIAWSMARKKQKATKRDIKVVWDPKPSDFDGLL